MKLTRPDGSPAPGAKSHLVCEDGPVSLEVVERVFELYCLGWPNTKIADEVGLSRPTVAKYINVGRPSSGIEPLKDRRRRIFRQAADKRDAQIVDRLSRISEATTKAIEVAADRWTKRVSRADELENPDLYVTDNRPMLEAVRAGAQNPSAADIKTFADVAIAAEGVREPASSAGVNLTVQQFQEAAAQSAASSAVGDIDDVRDYVGRMRKAIGEEQRNQIATILERTNSMLEGRDPGECREAEQEVCHEALSGECGVADAAIESDGGD